MPKNSKGGKGAKKGKNQHADGGKRDITLKSHDQEYAQVIQAKGECRFEVYCFDGKTRLAHVPGKLKRRVWFVRDDIALVQLREYQPEKCDLLLKYNQDEIAKLKRMGEIPVKAGINEVDILDVEVGDADIVEFTTDLDAI